MDPRFEAVDALFAPCDKTTSPGCSLAIFQDGQILYTRGYGMANLEHAIPNQPWTRFYLASMSKQFTAFCIALLEEAGKLSLDDDLRQYFPQLPAYQAPITIRHLVHHTSGLRDYLGLAFLSGRPMDDLIVEAEVLEMLGRQKALNFCPGDEFLYSNSGYVLLSMIVAKASGKSFRQYIDEAIFQPLGMAHTHAQDNHLEPVPQRATGYTSTSEGYRIAIPNFDVVGDGGLYSTVLDLFKWDENFYHNRLGQGRPELIERVLTPGVLNNGEKLSYAYGLMAGEYKGLREVSHGGGYGGYATQMTRYPDQHFSVAVLGNSAGLDPTGKIRQIAEIFLAGQFAEQPAQQAKPALVSLPASDLKAKTGRYYSSKDGLTVDVTEKESRLYADLNGLVLPLSAVDAHTFLTDGAPLSLRLVFNGDRLDMAVQSHAMPFERLEPYQASTEELAGMCGRYFSEELQARAEIDLQDGQPVFKIRYQRERLKPGSKDMYLMGNGALFIERGGDAGVTGFTIQAGRVRDIRFVRV